MLNIIRNFFISNKVKRDLLRNLLRENINIKNIKYFTIVGNAGAFYSPPDFNYLVINDFLQSYKGSYERNFKEFHTGLLYKIELTIKNGNLSTYEVFIP